MLEVSLKSHLVGMPEIIVQVLLFSIVDPVVATVGGWWSTLFYIIISNSIICILIIIGNVFVRFSYITPGLLVIAIQAVMIGWQIGRAHV